METAMLEGGRRKIGGGLMRISLLACAGFF